MADDTRDEPWDEPRELSYDGNLEDDGVENTEDFIDDSGELAGNFLADVVEEYAGDSTDEDTELATGDFANTIDAIGGDVLLDTLGELGIPM